MIRNVKDALMMLLIVGELGVIVILADACSHQRKLLREAEVLRPVAGIILDCKPAEEGGQWCFIPNEADEMWEERCR
jgi:hypothetical protein